MGRKSWQIILVDSREEIEKKLREKGKIPFIALFDHKKVFRVALGIEDVHKMSQSLKRLLPYGYEVITYGISGTREISLAFYGYGHVAPSVSENMLMRIEKCIQNFLSSSEPAT